MHCVRVANCSVMQAAKEFYGEEAWRVMSAAEKHRAVLEHQSSRVEQQGPLLMLEGPSFDINAGELVVSGQVIHVEEEDHCPEQDHAVATSRRVMHSLHRHTLTRNLVLGMGLRLRTGQVPRMQPERGGIEACFGARGR